MSDFKDIEKLIGYEFKDKRYIAKALTHPSYATIKHIPNYERLEFLGDAVLDLVISEFLFDEFKEEQEGALAKRRSGLVRGETLANVARELGLGEHLKMSSGEEANNGKDNNTNLENTFEAIIGAIYIDGGLEEARKFTMTHLEEKARNMKEPPKDPKTLLQEKLQAVGKPTPIYEVISTEGPSHSPEFTIEIKVDGYDPAQAKGSSKKVAERAAALIMLEQIGQDL